MDINAEAELDFSSEVNHQFVNPANPALFPRVANLSRNFESYRFHKLTFHYKGSCPYTKEGVFLGMMETDVLDNPPQTKREVLNHINCFREQVFNNTSFTVKKKDLARVRYCRDSEDTTLPGLPRDNRFDHVGRLYFGTYGCAVTAETGFAAGELWVEYDLELISPCVPTTGALPATGMEFTGSSSITYQPTPGGTNWLDIVQPNRLVESFENSLRNSTIFCTYANSVGLGALIGPSLPAGRYLVELFLAGPVTSLPGAHWGLQTTDGGTPIALVPESRAVRHVNNFGVIIEEATQWIVDLNSTSNVEGNYTQTRGSPHPSFALFTYAQNLLITSASLFITKLANKGGKIVT